MLAHRTSWSGHGMGVTGHAHAYAHAHAHAPEWGVKHRRPCHAPWDPKVRAMALTTDPGRCSLLVDTQPRVVSGCRQGPLVPVWARGTHCMHATSWQPRPGSDVAAWGPTGRGIALGWHRSVRWCQPSPPCRPWEHELQGPRRALVGTRLGWGMDHSRLSACTQGKGRGSVAGLPAVSLSYGAWAPDKWGTGWARGGRAQAHWEAA